MSKKNIQRLLIIIVILIIIIMILIKAYYIENKKVVFRKETIINENIDESLDGFTIAYFSDLHFSNEFDHNILINTVKHLKDIDPDIIIFGGDLFKIDPLNKVSDTNIEFLVNNLNELTPRFGKYAVYGDNDLIKEQKDITSTILKQCDFKIINNQAIKIFNNQKDYINLVGIEPFINNEENTIKNIYEGIDKTKFILTICHTPDSVELLSNEINTLMLSAHSHGGYINLPFIGGILMDDGAKKHISGKEKINNITLDINNGLGNDKYNFRFNTPKEVTIYKIKNQ